MIAGFSLQVSEFIKPTFAVVAAWQFAEGARDPNFPGSLISTTLYAATLGLIIAQHDTGREVVLSAVWMAQLFPAGLPMWLVGGLALFSVPRRVGAYVPRAPGTTAQGQLGEVADLEIGS